MCKWIIGWIQSLTERDATFCKVCDISLERWERFVHMLIYALACLNFCNTPMLWLALLVSIRAYLESWMGITNFIQK